MKVLSLLLTITLGKVLFTERYSGQSKLISVKQNVKRQVWSRRTGSSCTLKSLTVCKNMEYKLNDVILDF